MQALLQREIIVPICLNDINHIVQEIKIPLKTIYNGNEKVTILIPECLKEWLIDDFDLIIHQNKVITTNLFAFATIKVPF